MKLLRSQDVVSTFIRRQTLRYRCRIVVLETDDFSTNQALDDLAKNLNKSNLGYIYLTKLTRAIF